MMNNYAVFGHHRWAAKKAKIPRWHWGMNYFGIGNGRTVSLCDPRPWYGHFDYVNGLNKPKPRKRINSHYIGRK
jgi:hypothetical protein